MTRRRTLDNALFLALDSVPMWARRGPYLPVCRWLMNHWTRTAGAR